MLKVGDLVEREYLKSGSPFFRDNSAEVMVSDIVNIKGTIFELVNERGYCQYEHSSNLVPVR